MAEPPSAEAIAAATEQARRLALRQLREAMEQEKQRSSLATRKVRTGWLGIARKAKVAALRKDVERLALEHDKEVQRRNALVQMLDMDMEEADEQYQHAVRKHLQHLQTIISLQDETLGSMEREFHRQLTELEAEFVQERRWLEEQHAGERLRMQHLINELDQQASAQQQVAATQHERQRELINTDHLERVHKLQSRLDSRLEQLSLAFQKAHRDYVASTDARTQDYKALVLRDRTLSLAISTRKERADDLRQRVVSWRAKSTNLTRDEESRTSDMEQAKTSMMAHCRRLKAFLGAQRKQAWSQLTTLSRRSQEAKSQVAGATQLAESVMVLAEQARKLESMGEKMDPFQREEQASRRVKQRVTLPTPERPERPRYEVELENPDQQLPEPPASLPGLSVDSQQAADGADSFERPPPLEADSMEHSVCNSAVGDASDMASPVADLRRDMESLGELEAAMREAAATPEPRAARNHPVWVHHADEEVGKEAEAATAAGAEAQPAGAPAAEVKPEESLNNFFRRYNRVVLDTVALERDKKELLDTNARMRSMLQQILGATSIATDEVNGPNNLLVVNGRTNMNQPLPVQVAGRKASVVHDVALVHTHAQAVGKLGRTAAGMAPSRG